MSYYYYYFKSKSNNTFYFVSLSSLDNLINLFKKFVIFNALSPNFINGIRSFKKSKPQF